jgi:hypothetical protein
MEPLSAEQQLYEIRQEFYDEAAAFKSNRLPIERQQALAHINALLDAYWDVTYEIGWDKHATGQA